MQPHEERPTASPEKGVALSPAKGLALRPTLFVVAAALIVAASLYFAYFHKAGMLHYLADREDALRRITDERPALVAAAIFGIYVLTAALSIPLGIVLSVFTGWLFNQFPYGMVAAIILINFASTAGATLAFLISRYLLRDAISHRFTGLLTKADELLERDGAFYLLSLRLVHVIPFWLINLIMGWTTISIRTFWWASQLGMLPATILYVYAGHKLPSIDTLATEGVSSILEPRIVGVFVLLAMLPLALKWLIDRVRKAT